MSNSGSDKIGPGGDNDQTQQQQAQPQQYHLQPQKHLLQQQEQYLQQQSQFHHQYQLPISQQHHLDLQHQQLQHLSLLQQQQPQPFPTVPQELLQSTQTLSGLTRPPSHSRGASTHLNSAALIIPSSSSLPVVPEGGGGHQEVYAPTAQNRSGSAKNADGQVRKGGNFTPDEDAIICLRVEEFINSDLSIGLWSSLEIELNRRGNTIFSRWKNVLAPQYPDLFHRLNDARARQTANQKKNLKILSNGGTIIPKVPVALPVKKKYAAAAAPAGMALSVPLIPTPPSSAHIPLDTAHVSKKRKSTTDESAQEKAKRVTAPKEARSPNAAQSKKTSSGAASNMISWTPAMDALLMEGVNVFGKSWVRIAELVGNGVDNERCFQRWKNTVDPALKTLKQGPWDDDEIALLSELVVTHARTPKPMREPEPGKPPPRRPATVDWTKVSEALQRPVVQCRHKWNFLEKAAQRQQRDSEDTTDLGMESQLSGGSVAALDALPEERPRTRSASLSAEYI